MTVAGLCLPLFGAAVAARAAREEADIAQRRAVAEHCHHLWRFIEERFRQAMHRFGRAVPRLRRIAVEHCLECDCHRIALRFDSADTYFFDIDPRRFDLRDNEPQFHSAELERLWWRCFEDHLLDLDLRQAQEAFDVVRRGMSDHDLIARAYRELRLREEHIRRHHRQHPPMFVNGDLAPELHLRPGAVNYVRNLTATEVVARQVEAMGRLASVEPRPLDAIDYRALMGAFFEAGGDIGDQQAQDKGLALLTDNLTPAQREQYETHKHFEVIGSDTGKRYRIKHGRQMNIDELDKNGDVVCGWCFLPQGGLVAGDCMLAQKIALETDERAALKVANRFGGATAGPPPQMRYVDLRPGVVSSYAI